MALTLRMNDEEQTVLNRVQRQLNQSTASGAIKELITGYESAIFNLQSRSQKIVELQAEVNSLRSLIIGFVEADKRRNELLSQMKEV